MKFDFTYHNPTRIHFGKDSMSHLEEELSAFGKNVLLVYGKGAIKKHGIYDKIVSVLNKCNKTVTELEGIKPNPTYSQVLLGAKLVKENEIDLILAVGGGSVIDCAKAISVSAYCEGDPWQKYWVDFKPLDNATVPVAAILTMVGTASEMNAGSVITNEDTKIKEGRIFPPHVSPVFSILNPEYTYTVPKNQMVSGIYDIMSHLCEQYFSGDDENVSDYILLALMKSLISSSRKALEDPFDYEARSNIMWCSTMALNKITGVSKTHDWQVHGIEHQIGAYTDCPHGVGLAIVSIPYYKHIYIYGIDKFVTFATEVFGISGDGKTKEKIAECGINALRDFIVELEIPLTLREIGVTRDMLKPIAYSIEEGGGYKKVTHEEMLTILEECF